MKTLKSSFNIEGSGLMSALSASLEIVPSREKGIRFHIGGVTIPAALESVVSTEHFVTLATDNGGLLTKIALVEHFMAACAICGIEALDVHFNSQGFEFPIFDGSAKVWIEKFNDIGFVGEEEIANPLKDAIYFEKDKSFIAILPSEQPTKIVYSVNYDHPDLRNRWADSTNIHEIVGARTFGFLKDLDMLQKAGYSKGVTIDNTVGLKDDGTYTTVLRSEFEPVKHKILDIIGDLYLSGYNPLKLNAKIVVKEAGHALHIEAAKILKDILDQSRQNSQGS